jgi:DNA repair protein RadC
MPKLDTKNPKNNKTFWPQIGPMDKAHHQQGAYPALDDLKPIRVWPKEERPRERLFNLGPGALADAELVAILLGTGSRRCTALFLAHQLLQVHGGLGNLGRISAGQLASLSGIGPAKAARVLAACELGRRRERKRADPAMVIHTPAEAAQLALTHLRDLTRECCLAIYLDTKHRVLKEEIISIGSLDQAALHPRELFKSAFEVNAAALILAHNHPSGDATPSAADVRLTGQLQQAAKLLGICLLDHVIIGNGEYRSIVSEPKPFCPGGDSVRERQGNDDFEKSPFGGLRRLK